MKKALGIVFIIIFSTIHVFAQPKSLDKVAAVVGSAVILQSDVEQQYAQYLAKGNKEDEQVRCYIIQQLLTQKLLSQQAVIDSISVTDEDVDDNLDRRMRAFISQAGGQERLEKFLNRSLLQYKEEIRGDVQEQLVADKMQRKITEKVTITPLEVKRFYEAIPKDSLPYFNTEVEVGEIVAYPKLNKAEKEIFHDKAESLRLRIKAGEDFGTLAKLYSQDPGSAPEGGDLGFFDRSTMVKEFTATAFKLKAGEISQVFETEHGFHILQVIERRGEQVNARHILIKMEPTNASLARAKAHIDSIYQDVITKKIPF